MTPNFSPRELAQLDSEREISDARCGLSAAKRRVLGLALDYSMQRGEYVQTITLGAV